MNNKLLQNRVYPTPPHNTESSSIVCMQPNMHSGINDCTAQLLDYRVKKQ
uniref:Uncharacterized protein n=1 Tax=Anguilla anguilla TaxID=7936 RepID=A0A0E9TZ93_ANGAN